MQGTKMQNKRKTRLAQLQKDHIFCSVQYQLNPLQFSLTNQNN